MRSARRNLRSNAERRRIETMADRGENAAGLERLGKVLYALVEELYPLCRSLTGEGVRQTLEILRHGAAASKILDVRGPLMVERRFDPLMKMELFLKDIRLMLEAGQELHVPLPRTGMMQQLYTAACPGGQAKQDLSGIVRLYEAMAGLGCRDADDAAGSDERGRSHG